MGDVMDRVRALSAAFEVRTGYRAYQYTSDPGDGLKIVFQGGVFSRPDRALAYMLELTDALAAGRWDHWDCRVCAHYFLSEVDRDAHEREAHPKRRVGV